MALTFKNTECEQRSVSVTGESDRRDLLFHCKKKNLGQTSESRKSKQYCEERDDRKPDSWSLKRKWKVKELKPLSAQSWLLWAFICMYAHVKPLHGEQARQHLCCTRTSACVTLYTSSCFLSISISFG